MNPIVPRGPVGRTVHQHGQDALTVKNKGKY